ncbi:hypothetical protein K5V21_12675 [Clostridium sardiniense]|uniref:Pentapeptide repeat-containing protein n=1 Tax=Clostridium sardiniense TaxID=29369 RepID=A0ABS7L0N0_CLOSR|nr:pentapeptide repeat-containing protein [Clostridium sardiniense]MBY0756302.1 hypothetical protein [Clostridium sardiniense]MDQ0461456.1 hypothetical protein [Clostridium sardiniense]
MSNFKNDYELFRIYDSNGKKELEAVKSMLNESRDIESLYPYEAYNGVFESGGYRRQIHYYEQDKFAHIINTEYKGTYEINTYGDFKEKRIYKEYREKLVNKLINDKDFLEFKEKNKDKILVAVLNSENSIDNLYELSEINNILNKVNDDFFMFNSKETEKLEIDVLKEESFNLDINLGIEKDIDIMKEIEKSNDENAIKFIENYKGEINKKEDISYLEYFSSDENAIKFVNEGLDELKLIKEVSEIADSLDGAKADIKPYFENTFDIEKIKQGIEQEGIEKVAEDLKTFALWSGVEGEYNNSVVLSKDYIKDDIVIDAIDKVKQEAIIKKINSIMDDKEHNKEIFKDDIKYIAESLKDYRNDLSDRSFVEKLNDYLDRYVETIKNVIDNVKERFEKEDLEKQTILDKHLNQIGLEKENKEKEVNNYLESKGIINIEIKENLKTNEQFLEMLEEKMLMENSIENIRLDIESLPGEYIDYDERGIVTENIGSDDYKKNLNNLELKLKFEQENLQLKEKEINEIIDKEVISNSFGDKKGNLLLRLKDNEKFNDLLMEKSIVEFEVIFSDTEEERIYAKRELDSIKKEINNEIEQERGLFLSEKSIYKDLNKVFNVDNKEITQQEIDKMIEYHEKWVETGGTSGKQLDLEGKELKGLRLLNVDLENANLRNTIIKDSAIFANLKGVNFEGSRIENTEFLGSNIKGAKIDKENLKIINKQISADKEFHEEANKILKTNKEKNRTKAKCKDNEYEV